MSDPYGHGETCECSECIAWSEGFEAGKAHARSCLCDHPRDSDGTHDGHEEGRGGCLDDDCGCLLFEPKGD